MFHFIFPATLSYDGRHYGFVLKLGQSGVFRKKHPPD